MMVARFVLAVGICLVMLLAVSPSRGQAQPVPTPTPIPATFDPPAFSGLVCAQRCLTQIINVGLSPVERPPISSLDLMLLMDITGSMGDVLETVKASAADIVNVLRGRVPDMRIAAATYADYPNLHGGIGDEPFTLVSDFTTELDPFQSELRTVNLGEGGDEAESLLYALDQSAALDWRSDALRVLVVFTDAPPHNPDPGADEDYATADDLESDTVIDVLYSHSIIGIGVQAGFSSTAEGFLRDLASATDGDYFRLSSADEIPGNVVRLVGAELDEATLSFQPDPDNGGVTQSPSSFLYPEQGGTRPVEVSVCPGDWGLPDGQYNLSLSLRQGDDDFGAVPVEVEYYTRCSDFVVRDVAESEACNTNLAYWDSPAIVVRIRPDGVMMTQPHILGQPAYIYVSVTNRGPLVDSGTLTLYSGDDGTSVGEIPLTLEAGETAHIGPFEILNTSDLLSLRAVVNTAEDPVTNLEDPACDNNVALQERIYVSLDNPTMAGLGQIGGTFTLDLPHPIDAYFDISTLNGSLDVTNGDGTQFGAASAENSVSGTIPAGKVTIRAATANTTLGTIPVHLVTDNRGWMIYYTPDYSRLLRLQAAGDAADESTAPSLNRDAILVAGLLIALAVGLIFVSLRRSGGNSQ
jgi:hypothetical protein